VLPFSALWTAGLWLARSWKRKKRVSKRASERRIQKALRRVIGARTGLKELLFPEVLE
jgi:hypothetical protein